MPARARYRYFCGIGAGLLLLGWLSKYFAGTDPALITRIPAFIALGGFALLADQVRWLKANPHRGVFFALLPLLAHLLYMNWRTGLAPELVVACALVVAVLSTAVETKFWSRWTAAVWTGAITVTAPFVPNPVVPPVSFIMLMVILSVFLYHMALSYYGARRELRRKTLELSESQNLAQVGSWEVDLIRNQPTWSSTTYRLLEWPRERPLARFSELLADTDSTLAQALTRFFQGGESYDEIGELLTATGRRIWVHSRGQTLYSNGAPIRKLGVFTDITRHMQREQALREAKEAAEDAVAARTQFLANMSHEIRTPMNGVIGLTSLLAEADLAEEEKRHVQVIRACGESLLTIINDILDFAKLDAGKLRLENTPFDLAMVVDSSADVIRQAAADKGLQLNVSAPELARAPVGDPGRLRQVLVNLLSNAVKFTDSGAISLTVTEAEPTHALSSEGVALTFTVADTGIGIAPEAQAALFDAFTQADPSTTRKYGGTGLGLSICQELVQQMGGFISLRSEPGLGAQFTFTLTLPYQQAAAAEPEAPPVDAPAAVNEPGTPPPLQILLVEDNLVNQRVALTLLNKLGYEPELAETGAQAIDQVAAKSFDLVLMDVQMPEMDGLEATRHIRRIADIEQPRIVALTANAMVEDRARCLQAGMDDFLPKPVRFEDLKALLSRQGAGL